MCSSPKLLNKCLLNRILPVLHEIILAIQSGFLPGRSTTEQIIGLRCVIDACATHQRSVSIVFVDFSKAFDSVSRKALPVILSHYGVPEILIQAIMDLYQDTTACVITSHGLSDFFSTTSGVLQGDTLAPLLFILVLDYVLRRSLSEEDSYVLRPRSCSRHPCARLPAMAYADDIALLCRDPDAAQRTITRLYNEGTKVGLKISAKKTEVMHIGTYTAPSLHLPTGEEIEVCHDFKYLGAQILSPDSSFADRRAQAWRAALALKPIFHSTATDATKIKLFRATVEPILTYSLEAIPMTETRERITDASFRRLQRFALGIHYPEKLSNLELKARTCVPDLSRILRQRRLTTLGHTLRDDARRRVTGDQTRTPLALILENSPMEAFRHGKGNYHSLYKTFEDDANHLGLTLRQISQLNKYDYKSRVLSM